MLEAQIQSPILFADPQVPVLPCWLPQEGPQTAATLCPADETFFGGTRGGGKGQGYQALIATPFGSSKMGALKVGSMVCNPDGTIARVIQVHELGDRTLYRATFDDGATTEVTSDHLWQYRRTQRKLKADRCDANGEACNWVIGTTAMLMQYLNKGNKIRIPLTAPVTYTKSWRHPLNIDPYVLGLLLGDGSLSRKGITLTTEDVDIALTLLDVGCTLVKGGNSPNLITLRLSNVSELYNELDRCKLLDKVSNNKFIPEQFMRAPVVERWALLQGLMDTDGYADSRGHLQYTSVSKRLAMAVQQLVRSLGGKATLTDKIGQYRALDGNIIECQRVYMLYIQHPTKEKMFRLERKSSRCVGREWNGGCGELTRKLMSLEKAGHEKARCIRVDHPNGLYLTDDFIVTHNTDAGLGRHIAGAARYGRWWNGLLIRRKYKDLNEARRRVDELISQGMKAERIGGENQVNYVRWENGAVLILVAILQLSQADDLQGSQFTEITIDEAPSFTFIGPLVDKLKGCLRSPHGVPCHMFLTGNPGGPGASQIKVMYIPGADGGESPVPEGKVHYLPDGSTRVFIRSTLDDNQILMEADPGYKKRLQSIKDPNLRAAWLMGRWNVFVGQAFTFTERHIIEPIWPIPEYAPIYMTFDWGFGAPFSIGWWWVDSDNRIYRFAEWYGWDKVTPNVGLRLEDPKIAEGILERELAMNLDSSGIKRFAGPDCWNKKPDYKGGGQGPSTAEEFREYAKSTEALEKFGTTDSNGGTARKLDLTMVAGDPSKILKIRQFRNRLAVPESDTEMPMLVVYRTCRQFIRIIPDLCVDELTSEYLEAGQELHPFDEACHICMARPIGADEDNLNAAEAVAVAKARRSHLDSASRAALDELGMLTAAIKNANDIDGFSEQSLEEWCQAHLEDLDTVRYQ